MIKTSGSLAIVSGVILAGYSLLSLPPTLIVLTAGLILVQLGLILTVQDHLQKDRVKHPEEPVSNEKNPEAAEQGEKNTETTEQVTPAADTPANEPPAMPPESSVPEADAQTTASTAEEKPPPHKKPSAIKGYIYYQGSGEYTPMFKEPLHAEIGPPLIPHGSEWNGNKRDGLSAIKKESSTKDTTAEKQGERTTKTVTSKYWSFPIDPSIPPEEIDLASVPGPSDAKRARPSFAIGTPEDDLLGESQVVIET